jgi:CDP-paratose 2-epimerase
MSVAVVTGSSGLIGSETVRFLHEKGLEVFGIDNNLREYFFGRDGSVDWKTEELTRTLARFTHVPADVRDTDAVMRLFRDLGARIALVVHAAAQPSHDWAAREPITDFTVNANGTLTMLEATRLHCPDATFIFLSTNKVYGDTPNRLPLVEQELRFELDPEHPWAAFGIDESMTLDTSTHSLMGASKLAADVMTQEYGRYFGLKTASFRCGCLTGPAHSGAELHGFLAYLVKCAVGRRPYTIFGHRGKQVRDNIHSHDLVEAFWQFHLAPRRGEVYNMGGSRFSHCSVLEAIALVEKLTGERLEVSVSDRPRLGDHVWWISDVRKFQAHHPGWRCHHDLGSVVREMVDATRDRARRC